MEKSNIGKIYLNNLISLYKSKLPYSKELFILEILQEIIDFIQENLNQEFTCQFKDQLKNYTIIDYIYNIIGYFASLSIMKQYGKIGKHLYNTQNFEFIEKKIHSWSILKHISLTPIIMGYISAEHIKQLNFFIEHKYGNTAHYIEIINLIFEILYALFLILDSENIYYTINGLIHKEVKFKSNGIQLLISIQTLRTIFTDHEFISKLIPELNNNDLSKKIDLFIFKIINNKHYDIIQSLLLKYNF